MNVATMLENTARQYPQKTAIVTGQVRITYAELDAAANKVANALLDMKVHKGDRVAMLINTSPEFVSVYFGIIKTGAIAVPMDTRYRLDEITSVCGNCRPRVIFAESPLFEKLTSALQGFDYVKNLVAIAPQADSRLISYPQIMATAPAQRPAVELSPEDVATISYSGGTAYQPKGVMLTQRSLVTEAVQAGDGFNQTGKDVVMAFALPFYHMFGLGAVLLTAVHRASAIVIVPGTGVSIGSLMESIEKEKGTILHAVPYIYALAVKVAKREKVDKDISSLRLCCSGGAPLLVNTIHEFKQYYGLNLRDIYGLTEAVCHVSCPPLDSPVRLGSAGKALPGFQIRIVDDKDNEIPANHHGEVTVKGHIMKGYYNNPQATTETIKNGWLHTGDIGKLDSDGYLYITGRKKRMIILKGQNVYPSEVEDFLSTHPKIAQTRVIGVADRLRGEVVRAYICLKPGETLTELEVRKFCQERMADYKIPRQVIFTESIPKSARTARRLFRWVAGSSTIALQSRQ